MKKLVFATLGGMFLGIVLMIGVFSILNMKPMNENVMAQNTVENNMENNTVEDVPLQMETILDEKDQTEEEIEEPAVDSNGKVISNTTTPSVQLSYYIKVNRQANCVTIYTQDEDGAYTIPVKAMVCSVGVDNRTPLGIGKITDKYQWRLLFGNTYGHYSVRFNGHILFHSVPYMATSNDTLKEGQFNLLGQPASLGCIRLCVADAKWIYDNCGKGTVVEVYDSPDPGPLGKPSMPQISSDSPYKGWDPTDPNEENPWLHGAVEIHGVQDVTVETGAMVDLLAGVSATDADGLKIDVTVTGTVNYNIPGNYEVTYSATGVLGETVTETATVTIED